METVYYNKSFFKKKKLIQTNAQRYFILTLAVTIPPILATTVNVTLIHDKMNAWLASYSSMIIISSSSSRMKHTNYGWKRHDVWEQWLDHTIKIWLKVFE